MATVITFSQLATMLRSMPEPEPVFYRLYHDDQGRPICYSMEDLPGQYVEIDRDTFVKSNPWVRIRHGKLIASRPSVSMQKLQPGDTGTACHIEDVAIVVKSEMHQKWSIKHHDAD
jgi:hypothetical protein